MKCDYHPKRRATHYTLDGIVVYNFCPECVSALKHKQPNRKFTPLYTVSPKGA